MALIAVSQKAVSNNLKYSDGKCYLRGDRSYLRLELGLRLFFPIF